MSSPPAAKKAKMGDIPEHLNQLTEDTKKALVLIDEVQNEIDNLNEKASEEILKIEQKYNGLRKPFYVKRAEKTKDIPNFWSQAISNHPQLGSIVEDNELELLNCITNLEVEEKADIKEGFTIRVHFAPNEFFENEFIEKKYNLAPENANSSVVSSIKWKEGKSLVELHEADNHDPSLFQWLVTESDPNQDEIAEIIKDDLWPNPVQYFICPDMGDMDDSLEELADDADDVEEVDEDGEEEN